MDCGNLTIDCSYGLTLDDLCNEVSFEGTDFLREEQKMMQEREEHRAKANAVFENMMRSAIIEDLERLATGKSVEEKFTGKTTGHDNEIRETAKELLNGLR